MVKYFVLHWDRMGVLNVRDGMGVLKVGCPESEGQNGCPEGGVS